jgi:hypothetical protein
MQAGTQGDIVTLTMYQVDPITGAVTPFAPTGYTNAYVVLVTPSGGLTTVPMASLTVVSNVVTFPTLTTMFPIGGIYKGQGFFLYASGTLTKSRVVPLTIQSSLQ